MGYCCSERKFNSAHVDQIGWFDASPADIVTVLASGSYQIAPLGSGNGFGDPQVLKIDKPDTSEVYYLSYRQNNGLDVGISATYTRGVNIHRYRGSGYNRTMFIRSLYDDGSGSGATLEFVDTANEITITQFADYADGSVDVRVDFTLECLTAPPLVNISPAIAASAPAGSDDINVTVTNRDTSVCDARAFEVAMAVDTPLSPSPSIDNTGTLAPGAAGTRHLLGRTERRR